MKTTNVSSLRAELSRFLDMVKAGETIEILDRKTAIARLVPVERASGSKRNRIPAWLEQLAREGKARIGPMKGVPEILEGKRIGKNVGAVEAIIEERRSGR